jgi:chalcone isomerase-like protein
MVKLLFCLFFLVSSSPVMALEIAEINVPESVMVDETLPLQLNGAGIRSKFFFDIYIAELYLEHPSASAAEVLADYGHKRMLMQMLYDEVEKEKLVDGWNEGFEANLTSEQLEALGPQIQQFNDFFVDVHEGEQIVFDYHPGHGTAVYIAGALKGNIAGPAFNQALLSIWLGEDPVSSKLRKELLGGTKNR